MDIVKLRLEMGVKAFTGVFDCSSLKDALYNPCILH